ncbi:MAG TPA: hypothetical protein VEU33_19475 [Archangium sp.]|nr:hypothetical protein [Archangium sp.]
MSQLRLSFSALVISGMLFTVACGPQSENTSTESDTSTVQQQEAEKKKCDYNDPNRFYAARSPEECAAVTFICVEGQTAFFDQCGCGCETTR